ncbi:MAG: hypothetical protein LBG26_08570 [Treponema sp.]|jgi:hypothetical protein|nr:hypothetical protein [Treponema sp.]
MTEPIFADAPDFQVVFLSEYLRAVEELHRYALTLAGRMTPCVFHGFTSRIEALRDELAGQLPPDPRFIPFVKPQRGLPANVNVNFK